MHSSNTIQTEMNIFMHLRICVCVCIFKYVTIVSEKWGHGFESEKRGYRGRFEGKKKEEKDDIIII